MNKNTQQAEKTKKASAPETRTMLQDDGKRHYQCSAESCGYDGDQYCQNCGGEGNAPRFPKIRAENALKWKGERDTFKRQYGAALQVIDELNAQRDELLAACKILVQLAWSNASDEALESGVQAAKAAIANAEQQT